MSEKILIVDDETSIVESLTDIMEDEGYESISAQSGEQALEVIDAQHVDLVLMDVWMPGIDGIETLKRLKDNHPHIPVIMISGHGNIDTAVQATKFGAYDFIEKPPSYDKIVLSIKNALHLSQVEKENLILRQKEKQQSSLTGTSAAIQSLKEQIQRVAPADAWVLITGEHGTGKEVVAQTIHRLSGRSNKPMIEVNCAAIPEELIESELFGHEKGAFTGATAAKRGKFDLADGSVLFLDEIADMSLKTQAKILRILQEQKFERVGGSKTIQVDVRVLAATNKDLEKEIQEGRFREDLYWRLNVVPIHLPPLRERLNDLPYFVEEFLQDFSKKGMAKKNISAEALQLLGLHAWPGNVRELKNFIERLVIMNPEREISASTVRMLLPGVKDHPAVGNREHAGAPDADVDARLQAPLDVFAGLDFREAKKKFEREYLRARLNEQSWNISKTAESIGIERSHLHKKMKQFELSEPDSGPDDR